MRLYVHGLLRHFGNSASFSAASHTNPSLQSAQSYLEEALNRQCQNNKCALWVFCGPGLLGVVSEGS
jgi:hypothetical protein